MFVARENRESNENSVKTSQLFARGEKFNFIVCSFVCAFCLLKNG